MTRVHLAVSDFDLPIAWPHSESRCSPERRSRHRGRGRPVDALCSDLRPASMAFSGPAQRAFTVTSSYGALLLALQRLLDAYLGAARPTPVPARGPLCVSLDLPVGRGVRPYYPTARHCSWCVASRPSCAVLRTTSLPRYRGLVCVERLPLRSIVPGQAPRWGYSPTPGNRAEATRSSCGADGQGRMMRSCRMRHDQQTTAPVPSFTGVLGRGVVARVGEYPSPRSKTPRSTALAAVQTTDRTLSPLP
jgi:hypothetical protein